MTASKDFDVSPAQRAYLLAFDNWLHSTWKVRHDENHDNAARDLKDACLREVMQEAGVSTEPRKPSRLELRMRAAA